jgi:hypothetical protein
VGSGTAELTATKPGFRPSSPVKLPIDEAAPPPAVELVLTRGDELTGALLTPAGGPVAGGWVASFELVGAALRRPTCSSPS